MKHEIVFLPEVVTDLLAAREWYEKISRGLGFEFLRLFFAGAG